MQKKGRIMTIRPPLAHMKDPRAACLHAWSVFGTTKGGPSPAPPFAHRAARAARRLTSRAYFGASQSVRRSTTRRFCARPSSVLLSATGLDSPKPAAVIRPSPMPFAVR
jgi:hypothetical protein